MKPRPQQLVSIHEEDPRVESSVAELHWRQGLGPLAQFEFLNLAAWRARKAVDDLEPFGQVLLHHAALGEVLDHAAKIESVAGAQRDKGAAALAESGIGHGDHGGVLDGRVAV